MTELLDLLHPDIHANPYPVYAAMRRKSPVCEVSPGGVWAVSRYSDVQYAFKRSELFSSGGDQMLRPPWLSHNPFFDSERVDGPTHTAQLRSLLSQTFTTDGLAALEPVVRAIAEEIADRLLELGEADFVTQLAIPLPARAIGHFLGLDPSLYRDFARWGEALAMITPEPAWEDVAAHVRRSVTEMDEYLRQEIDARRRAPRGDMLSRLIRTGSEGAPLADTTIAAFLSLMFLTGFETTTNLLSNTMRAMMTRPDVVERLRADGTLIPGFIEEVLRHDPPIQALPRIAVADTELGGVTVPGGSTVLLLVGSANRDDAQFPDADRFDIERDRRDTILFGDGIHARLGRALARMETRLTLEALLSRFEGFSPLAAPVTWNVAVTVRGPTSLPVCFTRARGEGSRSS